MPLCQVGVVDVADDEVIKKGRLMPGNIFLVDFDEHRVVEDTEVSGPLGKDLKGRDQGLKGRTFCDGALFQLQIFYFLHYVR